MLRWSLLACLSIAFGTASASSIPPLKWGTTGHSTVASIAMAFLNSNASAAVKQLLPEVNGDLSEIANWADQVREQAAYKWSAELHFINTPDWECTYVRTRDCSSSSSSSWSLSPSLVDMKCVDGAIQNYTQRLAPSSRLSDNERAEALKFLTHFCGDITQPLHVGFTSDEGGNTEKGTFMEHNSVSLHSVWDTYMINHLVSTNFSNNITQFAESLIQRLTNGDYAPMVHQWRLCSDAAAPYSACSDEWASDTVKYACSNAMVETDGKTHISNGFKLGADYYAHNIDVVELQLVKGGIRLANVLNHILDRKSVV